MSCIVFLATVTRRLYHFLLSLPPQKGLGHWVVIVQPSELSTSRISLLFTPSHSQRFDTVSCDLMTFA